MDNLKKSFKSLKWYEWIMIVIMVVIAGKSMVDAFTNPGNSYPAWLTIVNFISAICGIICIFFCAKASISNYAFGIVNTLAYVVFLIYKKIYGTLCLEIFIYLPINIYGWVVWARHRDEQETEKTKSKKLEPSKLLLSGVAVLIISLLSYFFLNKLDGNAAVLDSLIVGMGITATFLQFFRYREQYIWWLIQDVIAVIMYIVVFDPVYLTKKSIYLIMAVIGLINWAKLQKTRNKENE